MNDELIPTFQCDTCGKHYADSIQAQQARKRAFPCGQKCDCGGTFCLHVNGVSTKKKKKGGYAD